MGHVWRVGAAILLGLLLLEAGLQLALRSGETGWPERRPFAGLVTAEGLEGPRLEPGLTVRTRSGEFDVQVRTDAHGFRVDPRDAVELSDTPAPGTARILVLGGAFAFGWGVAWSDSFGAQLERELARPGIGWGRVPSVVNASVPGRPLTEQVRWLEDALPEISPHLVVLLIAGEPERPGTGDGRPRGLRGSAIGYCLGQMWRRGALMVGTSEGDEVSPVGRSTVPDALALLQSAATSVRGADADLLVAFVPSARDVHAGARGTGRETPCPTLAERGIVCVDLLDPLAKGEAGAASLYFERSPGWTAAGHRLAARAVANRLAFWH